MEVVLIGQSVKMNSLVSPESQVGRKEEHRMSKVRNKNKRYAKCHGCTCKGAPTPGGGGRKASFITIEPLRLQDIGFTGKHDSVCK